MSDGHYHQISNTSYSYDMDGKEDNDILPGKYEGVSIMLKSAKLTNKNTRKNSEEDLLLYQIQTMFYLFY